MPFLTEELWHDDLFAERSELDCCIVAPYPQVGKVNSKLLNDLDTVKQVVSEIRNVRNAKQISPKEALPLSIRVNSAIKYENYLTIILKLANISSSDFVSEPVAGANAFMAGKDEFFISLANNIDVESEKERLGKDIVYLQGFLRSVDAKLSNERFMQNAKEEVVEVERRKKEDALSKIKILEAALNSLLAN
jgi:valyl-tRNA synthetase